MANTPKKKLECFVYLMNIDPTVTWRQLKAMFDSAKLPVKSLFIFDGWKSDRKDGIAEFEDEATADVALEDLNGIKVCGSHVGMRRAKLEDHGVPHVLKKPLTPSSSTLSSGVSTSGAGGSSKGPIINNTPSRVLFVSNVAFEKGNVESIKALFTPFGYVERVKLAQTEDGTFRGFATVIMSTVKQAMAAQAALCEQELGGRKLLVIFDKYGETNYIFK